MSGKVEETLIHIKVMFGNVSRTLKRFLKPYLRKGLRCLPVRKDKIVFLNYTGKGFGDNAKYIAEEILRRGLPWKLIWLVDGDAYVPDTIKKVQNRFGLKAFYELSTAGCIINNCKSTLPSFFRKKEDQFYLQTWHGDFALKYIEKEVEDILPASYVAKSKTDSAMTDAAVSGSRSFSKILKESFWLPEKCSILEYGVPRNDLYFRGDTYRRELKQSYGFLPNERILLYAPTFRDHDETDCYNLDFEGLRKVLCLATKEEWKIIVRLHSVASKRTDLFHYGETVINGTDCPDQQELCMISDYLVTDYSSIIGDFLLMRKPVFLYVPDLERYASRSAGRGLRDMYYHLPLSCSRTQRKLEEQMTHFDSELYNREVDSFMKEYYHSFDDGHASERIVDFLTRIMQSGL